MKKIQSTLLVAALAIAGNMASAQCYQSLSTSSNVLSTLSTRTNQLVVNNDLNTVLFIHRNDAELNGGDNGLFKYDISTDNGATWQLNQGNLNPGSTPSNGGRYPQAAILNPSGNTDPDNASLVYHGAVVNAGSWIGYVSGSALLDGSQASTENYNQAGVTGTLIPGGLCQSVPGTFWTIDVIIDEFARTGFRLLKGTLAGSDVVWTAAQEFIPDFNTDLYGSSAIADWNMAFDPSGQHGWIVLVTHLNGLSDFNFHPVFYHTSDGGNTWSGPEQLDLTSFASITSTESNPACGQEAGIAVDMNGHPHALIGVFRAGYYPYGIDGMPFGQMIDFTFNGTSWEAVPVSQTGLTYSFNSGGQLLNRPQISRSDDGSKMVFTWVESDLPASMGTAVNLKAATLDVPTGNRNCAVNYARCTSDLNGQMSQTTVSTTMIEESGLFTVPVILTLEVQNGGVFPSAQYYYLDDLQFTQADFTTPTAPGNLTVTASGTVPFCAGNTVELTASTAGAYLWNTGETTQTITAEGGKYWVIDPAGSTCIGSNNSIAAEAIPLPEVYVFSATSTLCPNGSVDLYANYYTAGTSILWSNGATDQLITVNSTGNYTVTVDGCTSAFGVDVAAGQPPANDDICDAQSLNVGVTAAFDNTCATVETNEPLPPLVDWIPNNQDGWFDDSFMGFPVLNNTVWFSFIAPSSKAVNIYTEGFDTQIALYRSSDYTCSGTLTLVAANDDANIFGSSLINRAYCLEKGKKYFIQVDGFYSAQFPGTILVTAVPNTVTICHNPNGTNPVTRTISGCGLADHLSHGDVTGACAPLRVSASGEEVAEEISLTVFPNPAADKLTVSFESISNERYNLTLVDITGRAVNSYTGDSREGLNILPVSLENFTPGMYFLVLKKGTNILQTRIIKE